MYVLLAYLIAYLFVALSGGDGDKGSKDSSSPWQNVTTTEQSGTMYMYSIHQTHYNV